jgi:uncharacterized cupin superfamily protein
MKQAPVHASTVPAVLGQTIYPAPFADIVKGRLKHKLGDLFGLSNFGVNLTELQPSACSALAHHHTHQDEFIFVVQGTLTLLLDGEALTLNAGDCYGFKAGSGVAHQLTNRSGAPASYLEIGDRSEDDVVQYPYDDLVAKRADGKWKLMHKNGEPY